MTRAPAICGVLALLYAASGGAEESPLAVGIWAGIEAEGRPVFPLFVLAGPDLLPQQTQPAVLDAVGRPNNSAVRAFDGCSAVNPVMWVCDSQQGPAIFARLPRITSWSCAGTLAEVSKTYWLVHEYWSPPAGSPIAVSTVPKGKLDPQKCNVLTSARTSLVESQYEPARELTLTPPTMATLREAWLGAAKRAAELHPYLVDTQVLLQIDRALQNVEASQLHIRRFANAQAPGRYEVVFWLPNIEGNCTDKGRFVTWLLDDGQQMRAERPVYLCETGSEGGLRRSRTVHFTINGREFFVAQEQVGDMADYFVVGEVIDNQVTLRANVGRSESFAVPAQP